MGFQVWVLWFGAEEWGFGFLGLGCWVGSFRIGARQSTCCKSCLGRFGLFSNAQFTQMLIFSNAHFALASNCPNSKAPESACIQVCTNLDRIPIWVGHVSVRNSARLDENPHESSQTCFTKTLDLVFKNALSVV